MPRRDGETERAPLCFGRCFGDEFLGFWGPLPPRHCGHAAPFTPMLRFLPTLLATAVLTTAMAQTVAPPTPATTRDANQETLVLSPFTVDATTDVGYAATSTLGGTRLKSELRDVASQIDV